MSWTRTQVSRRRHGHLDDAGDEPFDPMEFVDDDDEF